MFRGGDAYTSGEGCTGTYMDGLEIV